MSSLSFTRIFNQRFWQMAVVWLVLAVWLGALLLPAYTYFVVNQAGAMLFGTDISPAFRFYTIFRLLGLYALIFLWSWVMLEPLMPRLMERYGASWQRLYRWQVVFVVVLALLHPLLLVVAYLAETGDVMVWRAIPHYTHHLLAIYASFVGWLLLGVGLLMKRASRRILSRRYWLMCIAFVLLYVHSLVAGTDTHTPPLLLLWWVMGLSFGLSVAYHHWYQRLVE